jgi:transcription elongation factor GreA
VAIAPAGYANRLKVDFRKRLREAREFDEIKENDDYLQIKEEEAVLASRIHQLEALIGSATVVDSSDPERGVVSIGSAVKVKNLASRDVREHRLAGGYERMGANDISANSPVGQALIGRRRGDEVTVALPGDRTAVLKIAAVRSPRSERSDGT